MRAILTYHSIDPSGSAISLSREAFARHVAFLASGAVDVVGLEELLARAPDDDAVALTFDDGFTSFANAAWPLLREHGLPATLFVVTEHVGRTNAWGGRTQAGIPDLPLMDWDALGRVAEEGATLGAHSRTHRSLRGLARAEVEDELGGCASEIRTRTGGDPGTFAYPYGEHDAQAVRVASEHFRAACTTELRVLDTEPTAHLLPRLDAYYLGRPGALESWGSFAFRARLRTRAVLRGARARWRRSR